MGTEEYDKADCSDQCLTVHKCGGSLHVITWCPGVLEVHTHSRVAALAVLRFRDAAQCWLGNVGGSLRRKARLV
ncbi:hypothetical protein KC363_g152 [Hortaea werneckii]|nr:hypothetical protein KC363_g152 [Hortaea werneckii]